MPTSKARILGDAKLTASIALPNADATPPVTTPIDLGPQPWNAIEGLSLKVSTTTGTGVNAKIITITVQHSDSAGSGFAAVPSLATLAITAASSAYAATTRTYAMPPDLKRYVRLSCAGESGGGNASNGAATISILR
jgi:hypothetical protein